MKSCKILAKKDDFDGVEQKINSFTFRKLKIYLTLEDEGFC